MTEARAAWLRTAATRNIVEQLPGCWLQRLARGLNASPADRAVLSSDLRWLPDGSEMPQETECSFAGSQQALLPAPASPVHDDILLLKLRPGQARIEPRRPALRAPCGHPARGLPLCQNTRRPSQHPSWPHARLVRTRPGCGAGGACHSGHRPRARQVVARVHCLARASARLTAGPPRRPAVAVVLEHDASTPGVLPARRYRLHPSICIKKPVAGAAAEELAAACPEVFSVAGDRAVAKPARGNELYLEKVACPLHRWARCVPRRCCFQCQSSNSTARQQTVERRSGAWQQTQGGRAAWSCGSGKTTSSSPWSRRARCRPTRSSCAQSTCWRPKRAGCCSASRMRETA